VLILPVFIVLTLGVVDFARVFSSHIALRNAIREGALYATNWTKSGNTSTPGYASTALVTTAMQPQLSGVTVTSVRCSTSTDFNGAGPCPPSENANVSYVQVKATYSVTLFTPLLSTIVGGTINLADAGIYPEMPKP
jgi:Flp pilus assembly protein TadG